MGTFKIYFIFIALLTVIISKSEEFIGTSYISFSEKLLWTANLYLLYKILGSTKKSFRIKNCRLSDG